MLHDRCFLILELWIEASLMSWAEPKFRWTCVNLINLIIYPKVQCTFYESKKCANKIKIKKSSQKVRCCQNNNNYLSETFFGQMTWWVNFLKSRGKLNLICVVTFLQIFEIPLCCFTSGKCCQLLTMNVSETVFQKLFRIKNGNYGTVKSLGPPLERTNVNVNRF